MEIVDLLYVVVGWFLVISKNGARFNVLFLVDSISLLLKRAEYC